MLSKFFLPKTVLSLILAFISLLWSGTVSLRALDRYVVEPGTIADGNGGIYTDWSIAATQIQWALNASTNVGDTIWVSNGTYVLTNQIVVISNIVLRSTNGPEVTIVNGNFTLNAPNATTNNRCLFLSNASAFVSGFTFSNGAVCTNGGGGVWLGAGILTNCTVRDNICFSLTSAVHGGGIYIYPRGTVTTCQVIGNTVTNPTTTKGNGGGLYFRGEGYLVANCFVSNNVLYGGGEGAGACFASGCTLQSSLICNNSNELGSSGGAYLDSSTMFMIGCTVAANWASSVGGCYLQRGTITNCVISNNIGQGIYTTPNVASAIPTVRNSTIVGNTQQGIYMFDGGVGTTIVSDCVIADNMSNGVTMYTTGTNKSLLNCVVRNNFGGGVRCRVGTIRNCLIVGNTNTGWGGGGLFIQAGGDRASISSCTIVSNHYSLSAGAGLRFENSAGSAISISSCVIYSNGVAGTNDVCDGSAPVNYNRLQYSCIGTNPGFTGAWIIVTNPMFRDFTGGNYRLSGSSPCVNAGSNETWMTNACDLDKNQRIRYGVVDMGAYERINEGTVYIVH